MSGAVHTFADLPRGVDDSCDVVIIGTGAAGGAAGKIFVDAGLDVVFLEEGPPIDRKRSHKSLAAAMRHLMRDGGTQTALGKSVIPVLQGRCVGGSTAINSAICWRIPEDGWHRAFASYGVGDAVPLAELARWYDVIEKDLSVQLTPPSAMGRNNELLARGAAALGWAGKPTHRNVAGCEGSGRCMQTCEHERKRSVDATYAPYAVKKGARIYATCRAEGFVVKNGRVVGVRGRLWDPDSAAEKGPVTITARRAVVVAASAIQTPKLLGTLPLDGAKHVGRHLRAHPGTGVAGCYDERVMPWLGATQGYEVTEWRKLGIKIETLCLGPELGSVRLAGIGDTFTAHLDEFDHYGIWCAGVRMETEGRVRGTPRGAALITFTPSAEDIGKVRTSVRKMADIHFAAGARFVVPGIHGLPDRLTQDQLDLIDRAPVDPSRYSLIMSHMFGTARMAKTAADGVVGTDFQTHGLRGLYVVDSSIFPSNIGVNPQHTIMAIAMHAASQIVG